MNFRGNTVTWIRLWFLTVRVRLQRWDSASSGTTSFKPSNRSPSGPFRWADHRAILLFLGFFWLERAFPLLLCTKAVVQISEFRKLTLDWERVRLFDREVAVMFHLRVKDSKQAKYYVDLHQFWILFDLIWFSLIEWSTFPARRRSSSAPWPSTRWNWCELPVLDLVRSFRFKKYLNNHWKSLKNPFLTNFFSNRELIASIATRVRTRLFHSNCL